MVIPGRFAATPKLQRYIKINLPPIAVDKMSFIQSRLGNPRHGGIKANSHRLKRAAPRLAAGIIILIALFYVVSSLFAGSHPISLSKPATFLINSTTRVVEINGSPYAVMLASITPKEGKANIYIERSPILLNKIYNVTLTMDNVTHVAAGTNYSDIGVALNQINGNSVKITITAIDTALGIKPDYGNIRIISPTLPEGASYTAGSYGAQASATTAAGNSVAIAPSSNPNNTTELANTPSTTVTPHNTTTAAQNATELKAIAIAETDRYYPLMLNYSELYNNSVNCTAALYNSSYLTYYSKNPAGPTTYANESQMVPYSMYVHTAGSGSAYNMTFYAKSHTQMLNGAALTISVNTSSGEIVGNTTRGIFLGSNYTSLKSGYIKILGIGNACGVYVV